MSKVLATRILLSIGLGYVSCWLVGRIDRLPYSPFRDQVSDALAIPGGFVAAIFYPQGVHTGSGAAAWGLVAYAANVAFYSVAWFVVLVLLSKWQTRNRVALGHP
jgi:hypothetical protein